MKVILVNGSPHAKGCTYTALNEVAKTLQKNGIETEIVQLGTKPISGCLACGKCFETGRCIINDCVNEFLDKIPEADGFSVRPFTTRLLQVSLPVSPQSVLREKPYV